ncbi:MAG: 3-dehydroquinate synthase [bacterium]
MAKIKVDLKDRSYEIVIGTGILADLGKMIPSHKTNRKVIIITDPLVNDLYGAEVRKTLTGRVSTIELPRGERYKDLRAAAKLYDELVKLDAHRDSLIIALGGGVIGDLAGFVAATYMRGIDYVNVPTTLLAQVDASIGGKTGVNHPKCKNLIGCFYQPKLVYIDVKTLSTLPARELRTGLAEVVKYGVIKDAEFFRFLEANAHHLNTKAFEEEDTKRAALKLWQSIVTESAQIKADVVGKDERESGYRMILNYGHTLGHAIESLTRYQSYNHGEAVAVGMVGAAMVAEKLGLLDQVLVERIRTLPQKLALPVEIKGLSAKNIIAAMGLDKKVSSDKINFVLPEKIGKVVIRDDVSPDIIKQVLTGLGAK